MSFAFTPALRPIAKMLRGLTQQAGYGSHEARHLQDRRTHKRLPLNRPGHLQLDGSPRILVQLRDVSEGGAGVHWRGSLPQVGTTGVLTIDTAVMTGRVVRAVDGLIGFEFDEMEPEASARLRLLMRFIFPQDCS